MKAPVAGAEQETGQPTGAKEGGYYHDGAYTATMNNVTAPVDCARTLPPAQKHYYGSLLAQFRLTRATVRYSPPLSAVEALRSDQFISFPEHTEKVYAQWRGQLLSRDPSPVQLACMDTDTILELVRFLGVHLEEMLQQRTLVNIRRLGAWVWAILGRCKDRGELLSEEIGDLRHLAQLALRIQNDGLGASAARESKDSIEEEAANVGGDSAKSGVARFPVGEDDVESVAQSDLIEASWQEMLSTTLDMIVTVVGEVYGQRDLLDLRAKWTEHGTA
jgi:regulator of vacuolar morphogenesis